MMRAGPVEAASVEERIDPRLAFVIREIDRLRTKVGLAPVAPQLRSLAQKTHLATVNFDAITDEAHLAAADAVVIETFAERILRSSFRDALGRRSLPLASVEIVLHGAEGLTDDEEIALYQDILEHFHGVALSISVNGVALTASPKTLLSTSYWAQAARWALRETIAACEPAPSATTSANEPETHIARLRQRLRAQVISLARGLTDETRRVFQGARSRDALLGDLQSLDQYRRQKIDEIVGGVSLSGLELEPLADRIAAAQPQFRRDRAASQAGANAALTTILAGFIHSPLLTVSMARSYGGMLFGNRRLNDAEVRRLSDEVAAALRQETRRTLQALDRSLLGALAQDPLWQRAQIVREAGALLAVISRHD